MISFDNSLVPRGFLSPQRERREERRERREERGERREEKGEKSREREEEKGEKREERRERREERRERREERGERREEREISLLRQVTINITRSINKQPITTHLLVNNSQSEYVIR